MKKLFAVCSVFRERHEAKNTVHVMEVIVIASPNPEWIQEHLDSCKLQFFGRPSARRLWKRLTIEYFNVECNLNDDDDFNWSIKCKYLSKYIKETHTIFYVGIPTEGWHANVQRVSKRKFPPGVWFCFNPLIFVDRQISSAHRPLPCSVHEIYINLGCIVLALVASFQIRNWTIATNRKQLK